MNSQHNQVVQPAMKGNYVLHFFSSNRNADFLEEAVQCARMVLPESRIVVIYEPLEPCPDRIREFLVNDMNVEWREGRFVERSHFMGAESICGLLEHMQSSIRDEHDVLIRMRPDSMLLKTGFLRRFRQSQAELCAAVFQSGFMYNGFYAFKTASLRQVLQYLKQRGLKENAPESGAVLDAFKAVSPSPRSMQLSPPWSHDRHDFVWGNYNWTMCPPPSHLSYVDLLSISKRFQKDIGFFGRISLMRALREGFANMILSQRDEAGPAAA